MKFGTHGIFNNFFVSAFILVACTNFSMGQTRTNLDVMNGLVDSVAAGIAGHLSPDEKGFYLQFDTGDDYIIFKNHLIAYFRRNGYKVYTSAEGDMNVTVSISLSDAKVSYGDMFREGFLGAFYLPRHIALSGNYGIYRESADASAFNYSYIDTVRVDSVKQLENNSHLFTKGNIPPEPFFADLLEPIVAIGTAAVAVILFFTVRSK